MLDDNYKLNQKGEIIFEEKVEGSTEDVLYATNSNGTTDKMRSIPVTKGTFNTSISNLLTKGFETKNSNDAKSLLVFS